MRWTDLHLEERPRKRLPLRVCIRPLMIVAAGFVVGCDGSSNSDSPRQSPSNDKPNVPKLTLLDPGCANWSQEEALEYLGDKDRAVSAAVRLVQLSQESPLCVPETLTDELVKRLMVVPLGEKGWALGLSVRRDPRMLRAPVFIDVAGDVTVAADGTEEETLLLHLSKDADVYPHVLISPLRVWVANAIPPEPALTLDAPPPIGFDAREQEGFAYVGLMLHGNDGWEEIARYRWQPYELMYAGPASDALPEPPGGKFRLDMEQSPLLIPQGGEIPPPKPNRVPEGPTFGPDWDA